jgi:hypothetical protein
MLNWSVETHATVKPCNAVPLVLTAVAPGTIYEATFMVQDLLETDMYSAFYRGGDDVVRCTKYGAFPAESEMEGVEFFETP